MHVELLPIPRLGLRVALAAGLAGLGLIGTAPFLSKVGFCLFVAALCGSYRIARIAHGHFERILMVMFIPVRSKRWPMDRFTRIETDWKDETGLLSALFLGGSLWLFLKAFDWLLPWMGGSYKIWLRAASGKRVLAWQGMSDRSFETNRDLLQSTLGLPVERK